MAYRKQRGRNQCLDNPSVGNACTSFECTSVGNVPPVELAATSTGFRDNPVVGTAPATVNTSDDVSVGNITPVKENPMVGG